MSLRLSLLMFMRDRIFMLLLGTFHSSPIVALPSGVFDGQSLESIKRNVVRCIVFLLLSFGSRTKRVF